MTEVKEQVRLTQFTHGSGCGCKIAPAVLERILQSDKSKIVFPNLLVGYESKDDAAVYELPSGKCLISTVDFFTPIVDDAFDFGRIAAVNAVSDVYAMGGTPLLAVAILGWPVDKLPVEEAQRVLAGARAICNKINIPLSGGHSIDSAEPFFGLSVNGLVQKENLKKNNTARPRDLLFITKPIGVGIISSAQKRSKAMEEHIAEAIKIMTSINSVGEKLGKCSFVLSLTDVTGFGLLGHLIEMAEGSNCSALLNYQDVPLIEGIEVYTKQFIFPDNTYRNWNSFEKKVKGISGPEFITLCDPQTSGGLLVAVSPEAEQEFIELMKEEKIDYALQPFGRMTKKKDFVVEVIT